MNRKIRIILGMVCAVLAATLWIFHTYEVSAGGAQEAQQAKSEQEKKGKALADSHMAQWNRMNPDRVADWVAEEKERHKILPPFDNTYLLKGEQGEGHAYGKYTERDILMWAREAEKLVVQGSSIFHSSDALGSTVAVSCDMCHPDASNTHPETYPKFQTQMGRVALLRDMINWCIVNAVRGGRFDPDSRQMRGMEAYIRAQRKGVELQYGKH